MIFTDKKLLLFDLDGTLIDSVPDLAHAVNHMLEVLGRPAFPIETIRTWVGNGAETLVKRALSSHVIIDETLEPTLVTKALETFLHYYGAHLSEETLTYPHVIVTLKALHDAGYRLALVTNKPIAFVAPILKGLGINTLFESSLGGDSLAEKKPSPLPLLHLCETLNVPVVETLMIGDSKNDILAANAAKIQSVGVSYGYNYDEAIEHYKPDMVIDDFSELLDALGVMKV